MVHDMDNAIIIDRDKMADYLGLPSFETIDELNVDAQWEAGDYAFKEAFKDHADEGDEAATEAGEAAREKAEGEFGDDLWRSYKGACDAAIERYLAHHGMEFADPENGTLEITPLVSWDDAAAKVLETINGVGYFSFSSVEEFISTSSCADAREAVESHLHHIKWYGDVYGDTSALRIYERIYERSFR